MAQYPCRNCIYFKFCGDNMRTQECKGRKTKGENKKIILSGFSDREKIMLETMFRIVDITEMNLSEYASKNPIYNELYKKYKVDYKTVKLADISAIINILFEKLGIEYKEDKNEII